VAVDLAVRANVLLEVRKRLVEDQNAQSANGKRVARGFQRAIAIVDQMKDEVLEQLVLAEMEGKKS
jgi:hypothetical protein